MTTGTRFLRNRGIDFVSHPCAYEDCGGTRGDTPSEGGRLVVLVDQGRDISARESARVPRLNSVRPCDPAPARPPTGCAVGRTSPFDTRSRLSVFSGRTILELEPLSIAGEARGFLLEMPPEDLGQALPVQVTGAAIARPR